VFLLRGASACRAARNSPALIARKGYEFMRRLLQKALGQNRQDRQFARMKHTRRKRQRVERRRGRTRIVRLMIWLERGAGRYRSVPEQPVSSPARSSYSPQGQRVFRVPRGRRVSPYPSCKRSGHSIMRRRSGAFGQPQSQWACYMVQENRLPPWPHDTAPTRPSRRSGDRRSPRATPTAQRPIFRPCEPRSRLALAIA
jgi:hypothetical protein